MTKKKEERYPVLTLNQRNGSSINGKAICTDELRAAGVPNAWTPAGNNGIVGIIPFKKFFFDMTRHSDCWRIYTIHAWNPAAYINLTEVFKLEANIEYSGWLYLVAQRACTDPKLKVIYEEKQHRWLWTAYNNTQLTYLVEKLKKIKLNAGEDYDYGDYDPSASSLMSQLEILENSSGTAKPTEWFRADKVSTITHF